MIPFAPERAGNGPFDGRLFDRVMDRVRAAFADAASAADVAAAILALVTGTGVLQQAIVNGALKLSTLNVPTGQVPFGRDGVLTSSPFFRALPGIASVRSALAIGDATAVSGGGLGSAFAKLLLFGSVASGPARLFMQTGDASGVTDVWLVGDLGFNTAIGVLAKYGSGGANLLTIGNVSPGGGVGGANFAVQARGSDGVSRYPITFICSTGPDLATQFSADTLVGLFGVAPVGQQAGGAATAGATYTATEQGMINRMYTALRNLGAMT